MRRVTRSLIFVAVLGWAVAGVGAAYFIWQGATNTTPAADAQSPSSAPAAQAGALTAVPPPVMAPAGGTLGGARALSAAFTRVAATLRPAVVRLTIEKELKRPRPSRGFSFGFPFGPFGGQGDPFGFGPPRGQGDPRHGMPPQPMPQPRQSGLGSGVIIDTQGHVLTNNHVIAKADRIKVKLSDGRTFKAKVVGADPQTDLALIKLQGASNLTAARLGNSDTLQVGELVIAIGNPYGLSETVTVGVVSAKGRDHLQGGPAYEDFIQTDANINPGNSGGPLVNLNGEVVGINTAIKLAQFGYTGIGFAIPSNMAKTVSDQIRSQGRVRRAWLGVNIQTMTPDFAKGLGAGAPKSGALIAQVEPGSPAEKAGLKAGDVVTALDGKAIKSAKDLQRFVWGKRIGQGVNLAVWRDGQSIPVAVTTGEMPSDIMGGGPGGGGGGEAQSQLGLQLQNLTPDTARRLGVTARQGALVAGVSPGSPAEDAGLMAGDVIIGINRRPVKSADDAVRLLKQRNTDTFLLRVRRRGAAIFIVLRR